jgi:hypothetical protein
VTPARVDGAPVVCAAEGVNVSEEVDGIPVAGASNGVNVGE